jgi:UDP-N-acetylmuramoyl-tripeptide--D-alanyl-D-alanine ligase
MSVELKIRKFTPSELAEIVGGKLETFGSGAQDLAGVISINSKDIGSNMLFVAIRGERFDGHQFMAEAYNNGAVCMFADKIDDTFRNSGFDCSVILVDDTIKALGKLAHYYKKLSKVKTVAVTGSVGKTTTKEFIYAVAGEKFRTRKTEGNYNNEIGLPLTLFSIEPDDEVAVVEMGMSGLGEIEYMSKIAEPDIAVVTNIGTSHMEKLGSRENICRAKMEIAAGLSKDGVLLLNADEPLLFSKRETPMESDLKFMSVYNRAGDFRALNIRHTGTGIVYDLIYANKAVTNIEIPALGQHNVYNSLTAYSVGVLLGMSDEQIRRGLKQFKGAEMRQRIYDLNGITIIDDSYNASPESMRAGIEVLVSMAAQKNTRAAALLGDMKELGEYSRLMHDQLGQFAAQKKVELLFLYGLMADVMAEAAIKKGVRAENVYVNLNSKDPQTTADMINSALKPGDILLVKASRSVGAEKVIECMKKKKGRRPVK